MEPTPKQTDLQNLFATLSNAWDLENPEAGHATRFQARLDAQQRPMSVKFIKPLRLRIGYWMAASLALMLAALTAMKFSGAIDNEQLEEYAPEIVLASDYFEPIIQQKMKLLSAENKGLIIPVVESALHQLNLLETDYRKLEQDVRAGGNAKLILNAMLQNFRLRIELIESVLTEIEHLKDTQNEIKTL